MDYISAICSSVRASSYAMFHTECRFCRVGKLRRSSRLSLEKSFISNGKFSSFTLSFLKPTKPPTTETSIFFLACFTILQRPRGARLAATQEERKKWAAEWNVIETNDIVNNISRYYVCCCDTSTETFEVGGGRAKRKMMRRDELEKCVDSRAEQEAKKSFSTVFNRLVLSSSFCCLSSRRHVMWLARLHGGGETLSPEREKSCCRRVFLQLIMRSTSLVSDKEFSFDNNIACSCWVFLTNYCCCYTF